MVNRFADAIFWIAVACCVIAQLAIVRSSVVSPVRASGADPGSGAGRRTIEVFWSIVPGVVLALLFVATWRTMHHASAIVVGPIGR